MVDTTYHYREVRAYPTSLSIVVPCYNEGAAIPFLRQDLTLFQDGLRCESEVILVNDGSSDDTLPQLLDWAMADERVRVLQLSRNFGQDVAVTAGMDYARGDVVVLIDADLQDPLAVIHDMIAEYRAGNDVVYGKRLQRQSESGLKRLTAWLFYRLMQLMAYRNLPVDVGNFRLISQQCLLSLSKMRETHRFLRGMVAWVGYPTTSVEYTRQARVAGSSKYSFGKMMLFAWSASVSFSTMPLNFSLVLGGLVGLLALEEACRALLARAMGWYVVPGWPSLMVVVCVIGSSLLISLGILGQYVARIYEQGKGRPLYLVSRVYGTPEQDATNQTGFDLIKAAASLEKAESLA